MVTARSTWVKFSNRVNKLHNVLPTNWNSTMPKAAKLIVRNLEQEQPQFKDQFIISTVYDAKSGYGIDIRPKPGSARAIRRKHFGTTGVAGRARYPIYFESEEERERVLQELLEAERQWLAGGKAGDDAHLSDSAKWKLKHEGIIIRWPLKDAEATRFIEKAVEKALSKIREMFAHIIIKTFKGL